MGDSAMAVLGALSKAMGVRFEPHFRKLFPKLMQYCQQNRHNQFRAMAVGCLGDVIKYFALHEMAAGQANPATQEYLPKSFEVALSMAVLEGDEFLQMRQNSFFCLGALFQAGGVAAAQYHELFL